MKTIDLWFLMPNKGKKLQYIAMLYGRERIVRAMKKNQRRQ